MTITNARVVEHRASCGGLYGWRVEYTHTDGTTTFGPSHWLAGYARRELDAAEGWRINDRQIATRNRLIDAHIAGGREIFTLTYYREWGNKAFDVVCVVKDPDGTRFRLRARIGPRGGVTRREEFTIKEQED